ncbi:hypothetical protein S7335_1806 [Synechococcus sp. PCC 7335]|nr:hypothetical protein S7335_1806 [Synechococcus sp. PCC 7335]
MWMVRFGKVRVSRFFTIVSSSSSVDSDFFEIDPFEETLLKTGAFPSLSSRTV